jgi:hypothetical protein
MQKNWRDNLLKLLETKNGVLKSWAPYKKNYFSTWLADLTHGYNRTLIHVWLQIIEILCQKLLDSQI